MGSFLSVFFTLAWACTVNLERFAFTRIRSSMRGIFAFTAFKFATELVSPRNEFFTLLSFIISSLLFNTAFSCSRVRLVIVRRTSCHITSVVPFRGLR